MRGRTPCLPRHRWPFAAALIVGAAAAASASQSVSNPASSNLRKGCIDRFDPAADYFPDKIAIEDAVHFSVTYRGSYKVVSVRAAAPDAQAERYVLVQCGAPAPKLEGE